MKHFKRAIACLVVFVIAFSFTACGLGKDDVIGHYKLTGMVAEGQVYSEADLVQLDDMELTCTLDIKEGGSGQLQLFGKITDFTWKKRSLSIDGELVNFEYKNGVITMEADDASLTFTKQEG